MSIAADLGKPYGGDTRCFAGVKIVNHESDQAGMSVSRLSAIYQSDFCAPSYLKDGTDSKELSNSSISKLEFYQSLLHLRVIIGFSELSTDLFKSLSSAQPQNSTKISIHSTYRAMRANAWVSRISPTLGYEHTL